jgi:hypothetical protein
LSEVQEVADPSILYHYTTAEGLLGIVQSGKLRATDRAFLNDRSVSLHGEIVIAEHKDDLRKTIDEDYSGSDEAKEMLDRYLNQLDADRRNLPRWTWNVASLCERPDLLMQWIGYGQKGGYCVGLDRKGLEAHPQFYLDPVIYDRSAQIERLAQDLATWYLPGAIGEPEDTKAGALTDSVAWTLTYLMCCKNFAFENEAEWVAWNLDAGSDSHPLFRSTSALGVIPYVEWGIGTGEESLIREVWIGPSSSGDECERAVALLLKSVDLDERVVVRRSQIPFRW